MNFELYGGRTFLLTLGAGIVSSLLCWFGKLSGGEYVAVISLTVGAYIGANAVEKVKQIQADSNTTKDAA